MIRGRGPHNVAVFLGIQDAKAADTFLTELLRSMGWYAARLREEFQGFQVYHLPVMGVNVHYVVLGECVLASASDTLLKDVLRRKSNPALESLLGSDLVKAAMERLDSDSAPFNLSSTRTLMQQFAQGFSQGFEAAASEDGKPVGWPSLEVLTEITHRYFNGVIVGAHKTDEQCIRIRGVWHEPSDQEARKEE